jgi:titin
MPGEIIPVPTGFTATPNRAASSIGLRWIDNATTETDYLVEQSTDGGVTWSILQPPVARTAAQATQTGGTVTHARTAAALGATYTFRVSARNLPKFSDSPYATATVNLTGPAAPIAPTLAVPTVNTLNGRVALTWGVVAPVAGTTISYLVNVTVNGTTTAVATNRTNYTYRPSAAQLRAGLTLSFSVQAVATSTIRGVAGLPTGTNTGPASAVQTVNYSTLPAPTAPATFTATATRLTWTAATGVPTGATVSYAVEQSADGGLTWVAIAGSPFAASPVTFASAVGNNYLYRVQATASRVGAISSVSAWRQSAQVNTLPAVSTTPVAAATPAGSRSIVVAWTNASNNLTGFTLARSTNGRTWVNTPATLATVTKSGTTYSFTDTVPAAGTYTYRVLATSAAGNTANTAASNAVVAP